MNIEYKGVLNILVNLDRYMNVPAEVLSVLAASITKADAMYHFTLPEYDHPEGFVAALAVRFVNFVYNDNNIIFQLAEWFSEGINEMYYELVPSPDAILFFVIFNNPV